MVLGFEEIWHGRRACSWKRFDERFACGQSWLLPPCCITSQRTSRLRAHHSGSHSHDPVDIRHSRGGPGTQHFGIQGAWRSFDLTSGHFWHVAGCLLVALMPAIAVFVAVLVGVIAGVVGLLSIGDESASTIADHWLTFVIMSLVLELATAVRSGGQLRPLQGPHIRSGTSMPSRSRPCLSTRAVSFAEGEAGRAGCAFGSEHRAGFEEAVEAGGEFVKIIGEQVRTVIVRARAGATSPNWQSFIASARSAVVS